MARFVRIRHRIVNLDSIAWVDFPDSGRAMVFMRGLTQEKQNISLEAQVARKLRALREAECLPGVPKPDMPSFRSADNRQSS